MKTEFVRYLERLSELYPTIDKASTEIIKMCIRDRSYRGYIALSSKKMKGVSEYECVFGILSKICTVA